MFLGLNFGHIQSNAQIPNGDFETVLSDGTLSNWGNITLFAVIIDSSGNVLVDSIVFDGPFCGATTDAYSGNYALEMRNAYDYTAGHGISGWASVDEDTVYTAWGSLEYIYSSIQPQNFNFHYKYHSVNGDSGFAKIVFHDYQMNEIGQAVKYFSGSNAAYSYASIPISYSGSNQVFAYSLHFNTYFSAADNPTACNFGTRLIIDEITLTGSTNINDFSTAADLVVYPNPCTDYVLVKSNGISEYSIYDIEGKLIQKGKASNDSKIILEKNLPAGIYSLQVQSNGLTLRKNFVVN